MEREPVDHVAIMNGSWGLIPKILLGEKTIESRWTRTKRAPWNRVSPGDTIYFKNSGELVVAQATVSEVMQFKLGDISDALKIIRDYGKDICLVNSNPSEWSRQPKFCVLLRIVNPTPVEPSFQINKKGFGMGSAWITIGDVKDIRVKSAV